MLRADTGAVGMGPVLLSCVAWRCAELRDSVTTCVYV